MMQEHATQEANYPLRHDLDLHLTVMAVRRLPFIASLSDVDRAMLSTVVSELGSNILKYAGQVEITGLRALGPGGGFVECFADLTQAEGWSGQAAGENLAVADVLPEQWARYLRGRCRGHVVLQGGRLTAQMEVRDGVMADVPALVKLASLFPGEEWQALPVEDFAFRFAREPDGAMTISNLDILSSRGVAIQGGLRLAAGKLAGTLEFGLSGNERPGLMEFVPVLFRGENDGYFWTTVKLEGSADQSGENLSDRVTAALAARARRRIKATEVKSAEPVIGEDRDLLRSLFRN